MHLSMDKSHPQNQDKTLAHKDQEQGQLLTPFQRQLLQKSLLSDLPKHYLQRIEIMLLADRGNTQTQICETLGCSQGTARDWILMARSGQAHKWDDRPIGRPKAINDQYLERLQELAHQSPREFGYVFRHWTAQWLSKHLAKEFGIEISSRHINRLLKKMGLSTRPKKFNANQVKNQEQSNNSSIFIHNLSAASVPESISFGPFKPNPDFQLEMF